MVTYDAQVLVQVARMARVARRHAGRCAALALSFAAVAAPPSLAQENALALPPRLEESPGAARLTEPPADRRDVLEEVIVTADSQWRLPDLGTSLRREEEPELDQRMEFRLAPLYDPEKQVEMLEPVPVVDVLRDVGFLRIFEVGFGRRSRQN